MIKYLTSDEPAHQIGREGIEFLDLEVR